jgi:hypothetical protein
MAAGRAGELGARALLLEKNKSLGVKLLITGNGRCNLTNNLSGPGEFLSRFGKNGKFLFSSFYKFGVLETADFFESRGVALKAGADGKVFPKSGRAGDVLSALLNYLKESKVAVKTGAEAIRLKK